MNMTLRDQDLIRFLEDRTQLDVPGNALLIRHKGQEIFRHFSGTAKPDTLYRIFSMTKVATVTAALQLMECGLFTMDDPLGMYLPEYQDMTVWDDEKKEAVPAKNTLRVRDLFCMSAGLTYGGPWCENGRQIDAIRKELAEKHGGNYSTQEFARAIAKAPLLFEPGTHWNYSLCHDVLGALIEVLSGENFGEYLESHIFRPLGMENTGFHCPAAKTGLIAEMDGDPARDMMYAPDAKYESGGGGLLSTADDYMKFADALTHMGTDTDGVRILGRKTVDLLRKDQLNADQKTDFCWDYLRGYSYGLGVRTLVDPAKAGIPGTVGEFGWCGVLGTWMLMDPEEELSVIYMHQRTPNLEKYVQTHLRSMIYSMI